MRSWIKRTIEVTIKSTIKSAIKRRADHAVKRSLMRSRVALSLALVLTAGLLSPVPYLGAPTAAEASGAAWPASVLSGFNMPFAPSDGLVTTQNPPDFHWPAVPGATQYELQVSRSETVSTVVYGNSALTINYYNFPNVFDDGTWYWRVRYQKDASWSEWSDVRRFRIGEINVPFPVPPVEQLLTDVGDEHPRIWTKPETLDDFRGLSQTVGKAVYDAKLASVLANLNPAQYPNEPTPGMSGLRAYSDGVVNQMMDAAFIYLLTGSPTIGDDAKARLLSIAGWNPDGATSYTANDQVHRYITYKMAMAYDWLYDRLLPGEKTTVENMVKQRTETMLAHLVEEKPISSNPYDSHGWTAFGYIGIIATAMLHEIDDAEDWFRSVVPAYINIMPPWGGEDGGWAQGTGYWQWSTLFGKEFMDVLLAATGFNLYDKAFSRNEGQYPLYAFPKGSPKGIFGDGSEDSPGGPNVSVYTRLGQMYGDPRMNWAAQAVGSGMYPDLSNYFYGTENPEIRPPVDLPDSKWFQDIGLVTMHSSLYDPDRVSMYFKSSPYGSYNHSHADQNSFVINAFGEALAIESGYYDDYNTEHDKRYAKMTFSSNAITFDGKQGQPIGDIDADGRVIGFVTHPDFDAVSADATAAYKGALTQAGRQVIYVRPNLFVVVDRLKAANPDGNEFEWRLHAEDELAIDPDQAGATIAKGSAELKVRFYTPQSLRTEYEDQFLGTDGLEVKPGGAYANEVQKHAAFIAPRAAATTFVSTLEAYKRGEAPQTVASENHGDYMLLTFADGTKLYVRLTDSGLIDTGTMQFDGAAVSFREDSILLVDGTKLVQGGVTLLESDQPATIAYGRSRLSVSGPADTQVAIHAAGITRLRDVADGDELPRGGTVADAVSQRGVHWETAGNTLTVHMEKGQREFLLNTVATPQPLPDVTLPTVIDGVSGPVTLHAYTDKEGNSVAWGNLTNTPGLYQVESAPSGLLFERHGRPQGVYLEANAGILLQGTAAGPLQLKKVDTTHPASTVLWTDPEEKRETLYVVSQEAESLSSFGGKSFTKYSNRPFLSGGIGVGGWDQQGQWAKWTINVPRAGTYDLVLKYAAGWDLPSGSLTGRLAMIGNEAYFLQAPATPDWGTTPENWDGLRVKTRQTLPAGPVDITLWHTAGAMNLDWIGLIEEKADEVRPLAPTNLQLVSQADSVATVSWTGSTDNVAVKEYAVYANGVLKATVPAGTTSVTLTGLQAGKPYSVTAVAVDTSDNRSLDSTPLAFSAVDTLAPAWGAAPGLRAAKLFPGAVKLAWDSAADNSGTVAAYNIYRREASQSAFTKVGSVAGSVTGFDAIGLAPNTAYVFRIQAVDAQNNESGGGPSMLLTVPNTANGGDYYETFDGWTTGAVSAPGWSVSQNASTSVAVVELTGGGKALQATDNQAASADDYTESPIVTRTTDPLSGIVTFETRFKRLNADSGNYELKLNNGAQEVVRFTGFSDGTFGYWKLLGSTLTSFRIPKSGGITLPVDQWMTLRFDLDLAAGKYSITMQADAFKSIAGTADSGTLDKKTGTYRITGIPLYNNVSVPSVDTFKFSQNRYKSQFQFNYVAMYSNATDTTAPTWGSAALRAAKRFPTAARLDWDPAADNAGSVASYTIYRKEASQAQFEKAGSVIGSVYGYDVTGLTAGATYTFKVQAKDAQGNESAGGPEIAVTLPTVASTGAYYEAFDQMAAGALTGGGVWEIVNNGSTSVEVVPMPDSAGKALLVTDNAFTSDTDYTERPIVKRTNAPLSGQLSFETKFMFKRLSTDVGNFELKLAGSGSDVVRLTGFSDGTFGYWKLAGSTPTLTSFKIPKATGFTMPRDQWIQLRIDLDTTAKTYSITMQAEAFKGYAGAVDTGSVDPVKGEYTVGGIPFYNNATVSAIDTFRFSTNRYTSQFLFDYWALYP